MQQYSVEPRDRIFLKAYGYLYFARNIGKNIRKNLSSTCSLKLFDHAKQFTTDTLKTAWKRAIQKTAGETGDLIGNRIAKKIIRVSKNLPKNDLETNKWRKT